MHRAAGVGLFGLITLPASLAVAGSDTEPDDGPSSAEIDIELEVDMLLGVASQDDMERYERRRTAQRQEVIRDCMNEAGFDYELELNVTMFFDDPQGELSDLEYAEQWGFGIYTTLDPDNNPSTDLFRAYADDWEFPNQELIDAMSPAERTVWSAQRDRCTAAAIQESDVWRNPMVQQAWDDFDTMVANDPRTVDGLAEWQQCMDDAGHSYAEPADIHVALWDADTEQQFRQSEAWEPDSPDHAEWQALVEEEIEIAVAAAGCTAAYEEVVAEVREDLRPELVDLWQSVDWDLPPATYGGESIPSHDADEPSGSADVPAGTAADVAETPGGGTSEGLDLSAPPSSDP